MNFYYERKADDHTAPCIMLAGRLCEEAGEEVNGLDIPEKYMEMAVKRLDLSMHGILQAEI